MSELLEKALAKLSELPKQEQEEIASFNIRRNSRRKKVAEKFC